MNFCRATLCLLLAAGVSRGDEPPRGGALSPADEAATFHLADERLIVELAAAEPEVNSPVAVAWDADGRMYVAEMSDYPVGPGSGRVRLLLDRDHDGRYETAAVFADGLNFPNGVLCWRGGVFVTAAPDLWYLKDTDGDGRADERRVVWTGFGEGNQQLRANGLAWGLDHWIYGANGRSDGEIRRPDAPASQAVSIRARDFRFSPDGERFEAIAGQSQFGQSFDDWGHRFVSWNTIPIRHALLDPTTLATHPRLVPQAVRDIADSADRGRIFPIGSRPQTFNREATDYYNALCGLSIYRGDGLGDEYRGNAFVGESLTNLVHRRVLVRDGPTFVSYHAEKECEFLASTDSWFHPVNTATGPDGALYIVDFYRRWVEHPQFVPQALREGVDWREGEGHGRIWRIRLPGKPERKSTPPRLSDAGTSELVAELEHANGWRRDTAQRLFIERRDPESIGPLRKTALGSTYDVARVHALRTLHALNRLNEATLLAALGDQSPNVREQAVQLATEQQSASTQLSSALCAMADDPSLAVRFRLALSLRALDDDQKLAAWASLARQADAEPWLLLSVSAALDDRLVWPFLKRLALDHPKRLHDASAQQATFLRETAALLHDDHDVIYLMAYLGGLTSSQVGTGHLALLAGLTQATLTDNRSLRSWLTDANVGGSPAVDALRTVLDVARRVAVDQQAEVFQRTAAIGVLGLEEPDRASPLLVGLFDATEPQEVQSAAAAALGGTADAETIRRTFDAWGRYTAATRRAVAAAALRRPAAVEVLVEALELGDVSAIELDASQREALASLHDSTLRERVQKILRAQISTDRNEIMARYEAALTQPGDRRRGAALFRQHCLTCHKIQGVGHRVGADLSGIGARAKAMLLVDVLDPSRQVAANYMAYTLVTDDGQIISGVLASESAAAVVLRRADGVEETVPRSRIDQLRASGKSLMPDGFEKVLGVQDMSDLLEFLVQPERELLERHNTR